LAERGWIVWWQLHAAERRLASARALILMSPQRKQGRSLHPLLALRAPEENGLRPPLALRAPEENGLHPSLELRAPEVNGLRPSLALRAHEKNGMTAMQVNVVGRPGGSSGICSQSLRRREMTKR
jgi:hypothetical protein